MMGATDAGTLIAELEREALDSLDRVIREEPWRKEEARGEAADKGDMHRLAANSHFIILTSEA